MIFRNDKSKTYDILAMFLVLNSSKRFFIFEILFIKIQNLETFDLKFLTYAVISIWHCLRNILSW